MGFATWDFFICHATEDKEEFVRPLAAELRKLGLNVWYDEFSLQVGDSLRRAIDRGLSESSAGVVVLSPSFFAKEWPQKELDGLVAREVSGAKVILPIWHKIDGKTILRYSPTLADRVALISTLGPAKVASKLVEALPPSIARTTPIETQVPILAIGPDMGLGRSDEEAEISIREALWNIDHNVNPPLLLNVSPELLWTLLSDQKPLEYLGSQWSLELTRRLDVLKKKTSLTTEERHERLWLYSIETQLGQFLSLLHTAALALLSEPVLRQSGYLTTPSDVLVALKGMVRRAFRLNHRVNHSTVKLDVYRLRDPQLGVAIWVPRSVLEHLLEGFHTDNAMILTAPGGTYAWDLPAEVLTELVIPAIVLEVYRVSDKINSYKPDPKFLVLSDWFVGLG